MTQARKRADVPKQCKDCTNLRRIGGTCMFSCNAANRWAVDGCDCSKSKRSHKGQIEILRKLVRDLNEEIEMLKNS